MPICSYGIGRGLLNVGDGRGGGIKWSTKQNNCTNGLSFNYSPLIHMYTQLTSFLKTKIFGFLSTVARIGCLRFKNVQNIARAINSGSCAGCPPPPPHCKFQIYLIHIVKFPKKVSDPPPSFLDPSMPEPKF